MVAGSGPTELAPEITEANFGDVLLYGYADFLRERSSQLGEVMALEQAAETLEDQGLAAYMEYRETNIFQEPEPFMHFGMHAAALRGLAARAKARLDETSQYSPGESLSGKTVTIQDQTAGGLGVIIRAYSLWLPRAKEAKGEVVASSFDEHGGGLVVREKKRLTREYVIEPLVDPKNLRANVSLAFEE